LVTLRYLDVDTQGLVVDIVNRVAQD
jgi:hypothetical protein